MFRWTKARKVTLWIGVTIGVAMFVMPPATAEGRLFVGYMPIWEQWSGGYMLDISRMLIQLTIWALVVFATLVSLKS